MKNSNTVQKYHYVFILFLILMLSFPILGIEKAFSNYIEIPLRFNNWEKLSDGNWNETGEGIIFYGKSFRDDGTMKSKETINFINQDDLEVRIKWKANSSYFAIFWVGLPNGVGTNWFSTHVPYADIRDVLTNDKWYFTRIAVSSDMAYTAITSTENYDTDNGNIFQSVSGELSEEKFNLIKKGSNSVFARFGDNYKGSETYMVIGEVQVNGTVLTDFSNSVSKAELDAAIEQAVSDKNNIILQKENEIDQLIINIEQKQQLINSMYTKQQLDNAIAQAESVKDLIILDKNQSISLLSESISILNKYNEELNQQVQNQKNTIEDLQLTIKNMYTEDQLNKKIEEIIANYSISNRYELLLTKGWHLISSTNSISIAKTEPENAIEVIYEFIRGSYREVNELQPGKGYWVKIIKQCKFIVEATEK